MISGPVELNGRPARVFVWTVTATDFQVALETPTGPELLNVSKITSEWGGIEKVFSEMYFLGTGRDRRFKIVEDRK